MKSFTEQAQLYAAYHQKKATLYTHFAGIPLILFGIMIFLGFFQLIVPGVFATTMAEIATLILFIHYLRLNWQLALLIAPVLVLMVWLSSLISYAGPTSFALGAFLIVSILGWALQLTGHFIEGIKPAFTDNLASLPIAPLYLTAEACFILGRMQKLRDQVHNPVPLSETVP